MEKRNEVYQVDAKPGMRWLSAMSDATSFIHMTLVAAHHVDGGWIAEKHVAPRFFGFLEKASCGECSSCTKPDHDNHLISSLADGFPKLTRVRSNQKRFRPSDVCRYASLHITPTLWSKPGNAAAQEEPTDNNSTIIIGFDLSKHSLSFISLRASLCYKPQSLWHQRR